MKKVCVVTGSRSDYGLLRPVIFEIKRKDGLGLEVAATGMHLSPEFGFTYREIEKDGFDAARINMPLTNDTGAGISKSIGLGIIGFSGYFALHKPDIVLLLGDRFEIFAATVAAMNALIPIAHIHGGETGAGTVDNMMRHAITKMSSLHFVSTEKYRDRVIQLGEHPENVYYVGAPGIENIKSMKLLGKEELEKALDFAIDDRTILATFHPLSMEENSARSQFLQVIQGLSRVEGLRVIFTKANADAGGRTINEMIDEYVAENPGNTTVFTSLGSLHYLSALKHVKLVIGNSSSGVIEAPSLGTYTLNIGDRQKGRIQGDSVFNCAVVSEEIKNGLERIMKLEKKEKFSNPYEKENTACTIVRILHERTQKGIYIDKVFYDLPYEGGFHHEPAAPKL